MNDCNIAVADIAETKAPRAQMVTVQSGEMQKMIASTGPIVLYGIRFDFNKADIKPESDPTGAHRQLLKESNGLRLLVVEHTDNGARSLSTWSCRTAARRRW